MRYLIVLPGGAEVFSGAPGAAVVSVKLTRAVNEGTDLSPGAVCPGELRCRLTEAAGLSVAAGDRLTLYRVDGAGTREQMGIFIAQKPAHSGLGLLDITARDPLSLLEKDLTGWLAGLDQWPYTLHEFASMVCQACGLTLATDQIPNGGCPVQKFSAREITGTDLMGWVGQLSGRFCRANAQGAVELAWYTPLSMTDIAPTAPDAAVYDDGQGGVTLTLVTAQGEDPVLSGCTAGDDGAGNVVLTVPTRLWYYQGSLTRDAEPVHSIERVHLRRSTGDVGIAWPDTGDDANTYVLGGNYLLSAMHTEHLTAVAKTLYAQLQPVQYTPCEMEMPGEIAPGHTVQITDCRGDSFTAYVMQTVTEKGRTRLYCTGSAYRDNSGVLRDLQSFRGKVLELQADVDGLRLENSDEAGRLTQLEADVAGIRTRVEHQQETETGIQQRLSAVEQTAEAVDITVRSLVDDGASRVVTRSGYSFTEEGLTISRQGEQMCNRLDHTGMYVTRSGETILQANDQGVEATDVTVRNYLIVGDHARFEDYENGTACYYI